MIESVELITIVIMAVVGFIAWLIQLKLKQIDSINDRVTTIETKLDVMGDINTSLAELKTDVAVSKHRLEGKKAISK